MNKCYRTNYGTKIILVGDEEEVTIIGKRVAMRNMIIKRIDELTNLLNS